jgi:group II intron reverse transcriptase/maturase
MVDASLLRRAWEGSFVELHSPATLDEAFTRVRRGSACSGVDGLTHDDVVPHWELLREELAHELRRGSYVPLPYRVVLLDKPAGGLREIRIPTVRDRVVQQAVALVLGSRLDPVFSDVSFAYRPGRSREGAVLTLSRTATRDGLTWVARIDIRTFFDSIDHERLALALRCFGVPEEIIRLVRVTLQAGVLRRGRVVSSRRGCPQGSALSPLLSNAYLDEFDRWLQVEFPGSCRYADDLAVPTSSEVTARRAMEAITGKLADEYLLEVHDGKSRTVRLDEFTYLGFGFRLDGEHVVPMRSPAGRRGRWRSFAGFVVGVLCRIIRFSQAALRRLVRACR